MITGDDFIFLASKLAVTADADEASIRTAVSRSYYGAFHLAKSFLESLGFPIPRNENAHGFIQRQLLNCGHSDVSSAGSLLSSLHRNRIAADYRFEDGRFNSADFAKLSVEMAHHIKTLLKNCSEEPVCTEIQRGIAEYQDKLGN